MQVQQKTDADLRELLGDWWVDEMDFDDGDSMISSANMLLERHYVTLRVVGVKLDLRGDMVEYTWDIEGLRAE